MLLKAYNFPIICQIARNYYAIPTTFTPSKHVFNIASNLISKKRMRILSENV
jgi:hypothetical protein